MRIDAPSQLSSPASARLPQGSESAWRVAPTTETTFSSVQLSDRATANQSAQSRGVLVMPRLADVETFNRATFHPEFSSAYLSAKTAWTGEENQVHLRVFGRPTRAAAEASGKLDNLMYERLIPRLEKAYTFEASPEEREAWESFLEERGASMPVSPVPDNAGSRWKAITFTELMQALNKDTGLRNYMASSPAQARKWITDLTKAINQRSAMIRLDASPDEKMSLIASKSRLPAASRPQDNGIALIFRFESTYNSASHIAIASLWRDSNAELQMAIAHQESVPPAPIVKGQKPGPGEFTTYTGQVYGKFDTSTHYPGGRAPVVESMQLGGLPAVNVFTCPNPEGVAEIILEIGGVENASPYGASNKVRSDGRPEWPSAKGNVDPDRPYENCFDVTHKVLARAFNLKQVRGSETIPHVVDALAPYASIQPPEKDAMRNPKTGETMRSDKLPEGQTIAAFMHIGSQWGRNESWDVKTARVANKAEVKIEPGQKGLALPQGAVAMKFANSGDIKGLTLDARPVDTKLGDQTFTPAEAARMEYKGEKAATLTLICTFPKQMAKL